MPRLVLKANQIEAEATVAERRFAGALPGRAEEIQ